MMIFFIFFHFMIDLDQGPCIVKRIVGCGAGSEYMAVTPEGNYTLAINL